MSRMILERTQHREASFVTLTYDKEHLPRHGTLDPEHTSLWLKRLRDRVAPLRIRYFLCGEYGELSQRPHYHAVLFSLGRTHLRQVQLSWSSGLVHMGDATPSSMSYVAGYIMKKVGALPLSKNLHKEFQRSSQGLGFPSVKELVRIQWSGRGQQMISSTGDVIAEIKSSGKKYPLGRYLREKLREEVTGFKSIKELEENSPVLRMRRRAEAAGNYVLEKSPEYLKEKVQRREELRHAVRSTSIRRKKI